MAIAGLYYTAAIRPKMTCPARSTVDREWRSPGFGLTSGLTRSESCLHSMGLKMAWQNC